MKSLRKLRKKAITLAMTSVLAMTMLAGCGNESTQTGSEAPQEKVFNIGISQYIEHGALDAARDGFKKALEDKGYKDGEKIKIELQNAQGEMPTALTIAQNFKASNKDLVLGIGTSGTQALYNVMKDTPILMTAVTDPVKAGLVESMEKPETNVTGTSDALDLELQFKLLKELVPDAKSIGVLYTTSEANSEVQVKEIREKAPEFGLEIIEAGVINSNEVAQSLDSIIGQIDVLYVPTDNIIVSAMPLIYARTIERQIPIIASEKSQVENGALATEGIDYYELGYKTGLMAVEILEGKNPADMSVQLADEFKVAINKQTLEKLGIELSEDLKARAEMIDNVKGE